MSIYLQILQAVKNRVESVAGAVPVHLRRRPVILSTDGLPIIIVAPSPDGESIETETFSRGVTWSYPVFVVIFSRGNRELAIGSTDMSLREAVRDEIYQPLLAGAQTAYDVDMTLSGPFNLRSQENTTETDAFRVIYRSSELRSA